MSFQLTKWLPFYVQLNSNENKECFVSLDCLLAIDLAICVSLDNTLLLFNKTRNKMVDVGYNVVNYILRMYFLLYIPFLKLIWIFFFELLMESVREQLTVIRTISS